LQSKALKIRDVSSTSDLIARLELAGKRSRWRGAASISPGVMALRNTQAAYGCLRVAGQALSSGWNLF
jgi:hypothetical protein